MTFAAVAAVFAAVSCGKDNYALPEETFKGSFIDKDTGELLQVGPGDLRIRMYEYSWSDNPTPYDFNAKQDGTFNNTKIFKGTYGIVPEGPFVPLEEIRLEIEGEVQHDFYVEPFLRVEWVGEPEMLADGTVEVTVKITKGTDNPDYQKPLEEAWLYVNQISYVGSGSYSNILSTQLTATDLTGYTWGDELTVRTGFPAGYNAGTGTPNKFPEMADRPYFFRFAAYAGDQVGGVKRYNYTPVKEFVVSVD